MAEAEHKEEWITAAEALRLLKPVFNSEYASQKTICRRAHAGLIRARAERFMIDDRSVRECEVPEKFWWAEGGAALEQDWTTGDFTTWIKKTTRLRAFGVSFLRADIEKLITAASKKVMLPKEQVNTAAEEVGRNMPDTSDQIDLAISYASEDREIARQIATSMDARGYKVFYDEFENLWGEVLTTKLAKVYGEQSRFCLIIISENYIRKPWTNHECQFALSRALTERGPYILPLRIDDSKLDGLSPNIGYLDLRNSSIEEVCRLLSAKLGDPQRSYGDTEAQLTEAQISTLRDVISACYRRAVFTRYHAQLNHEAMFKSLSDCRRALQTLISYVDPLNNKRLVAGIIAELDLIERVGAQPFTSGAAGTVDSAKLRILAALFVLAKQAKTELVLPSSVTEELFFTEEEANAPPQGPETPSEMLT
jgi:hypothetical protein